MWSRNIYISELSEANIRKAHVEYGCQLLQRKKAEHSFYQLSPKERVKKLNQLFEDIEEWGFSSAIIEEEWENLGYYKE